MVGMDTRECDGGSGKPPSVVGRLFLSLFLLFFFVMGASFGLFILREFARAAGQRSWKKVPCRIVSSEVQERGGGKSPYAFAVKYQYEYAGGSYVGSKYQRNDSVSGKYSDEQSLVQKYPVGLNTSCYVNPSISGEAVLKRDSLLIGLVVLVPLIFMVVGAGGIYFVWRRSPPEAEKPIAAAAIRKGGKGMGKYGLAALFAVFAIVGGALLYPLGIRPIAKTIDAESWVPTPCKVLRAEVRRHDSDDGTTYSVCILYQYEFNGRTYKSDRYEFVGGSSSGYKSKARIVATYQAAANPICYVNPDDPSEAVLKRGFHAKLLLALFPLPFLLVGIGGVVHTLRGKQPSVAGLPSAGITTTGHGGPIRPMRPMMPADTSRAVLTPRLSARTKFIGATLIALFWNGILSIFVTGIIDDFRHGNPSWFELLSILPFVAIGIGLIGGAVYLFLATLNPRPTLEVSSSVVPLGGAAELQWSFSGRTDRISEFTVTLRGIEEARYRRGTDTCTDKNTFYELELYRTLDMDEIATGRVGFVMPQDTMHSFEAENNKVIWNLDIRGDIKGWPDVKESFTIIVTPAVLQSN